MSKENIIYIISQVLVLIAYAVLCFGFTKKEKVNILLKSSVYQVLIMIQFILLAGISGIVSCVIAIARNIFFINNEVKGRKNSVLSLVIFIIIALLLFAIFFQSPIDIFTLILSILGIFSYWHHGTKVMRNLNIVISICFIIYAIPLHSWMSIVCEFALIISTIIGILKHEKN